MYAPRRVADAFRAAGLDRAMVVTIVTPEQWLNLFIALERASAYGEPSGTPRRVTRPGRLARRR